MNTEIKVLKDFCCNSNEVVTIEEFNEKLEEILASIEKGKTMEVVTLFAGYRNRILNFYNLKDSVSSLKLDTDVFEKYKYIEFNKDTEVSNEDYSFTLSTTYTDGTKYMIQIICTDYNKVLITEYFGGPTGTIFVFESCNNEITFRYIME